MEKHKERAMGTGMRAVSKGENQQAQQDTNRKFLATDEKIRTYPHGYSGTATNVQWIQILFDGGRQILKKA